MDNAKEIYDLISGANIEYRSSVARNSGVAASRDRVKNVLFNKRDEILAVLNESSTAQRDLEFLKEQRQILEDELAAMDDENTALRKKIKELEAGGQKKQKTKTMTAVVE